MNQDLKERVNIFQMFLNNGTFSTPDEVYASWDLNQAGETHNTHCGSLKSASGAQSGVLDAVIAAQKLTAVHFIKIDSDRHEWEVSQGANGTIAKYKPTFLFEDGLDLWEEKGLKFRHFNRYFAKLDYEIHFEGHLLTASNANVIIPSARTINLLATQMKIA